jgi:hypothetical protein
MTDKKTPCVTCKWLKSEKVLVNPDGQVLPCCYMGNTNFLNSIDSKQGRRWDNEDVLIKYKENKDLYNLNHHTIEEILTSDWFNEDLPNSWESYDTIPSVCQLFCDESLSNEDV